jgi:hypothetical protein
MNLQVILERFLNKTPHEPQAAIKLRNSDWLQMERLILSCMKDKISPQSKQLLSILHEYQVQNHLLELENQQLCEAPISKKKHGKGNTLNLRRPEEFHGGSVLWSLWKLKVGKARDVVGYREAHELPLQKANANGLKAATALYKQRAKRSSARRGKKLR